jgi:hypothetical protein
MKLHQRFSETFDRRLRIVDGGGSVAGVELEYWVRGAGEPVVFLHGGILTDWFGYRLVSYHRPDGLSTLPSQTFRRPARVAALR